MGWGKQKRRTVDGVAEMASGGNAEGSESHRREGGGRHHKGPPYPYPRAQKKDEYMQKEIKTKGDQSSP